MNTKQHTIKEKFTLTGVGLHTGITSNLTFMPANPYHGIKFQRTDLEGQPIVEAIGDYVTDVSRGTTIEKGEARVSTIEHILAAIVGFEIDNVLIQIDGPEVPIMDGSAMPFTKAFKEVGTCEQDAMRNFLEIESPVFYKDASNKTEIIALPLDDYRVTVMIDYNSPVLGSQHASLNSDKSVRKRNCFMPHILFFARTRNALRKRLGQRRGFKQRYCNS